MSAKMKSRVKISRRDIYVSKFVNLPPELGGTGEPYHDLAVYWKRKVQEHAVWFTETDQNNQRAA